MVVFWGCGKIGIAQLERFGKYLSVPDFFCDIKPELWGRNIQGIKVVSPSELLNESLRYIVITARATEEIRKCIIEQGVDEDKIVLYDHLTDIDILSNLVDRLKIFNSDACDRRLDKKAVYTFQQLACILLSIWQ